MEVADDENLIAGNSAGGHLAALVGTSNGSAELEGDLGIDRSQSSAVQGIISFYGAAHGGPMFYDEERLTIVRKFLRHHF